MVAGEDDMNADGWELEISIEEFKEHGRPWRKTLIVKVLGKQISFRTLEKRLHDL